MCVHKSFILQPDLVMRHMFYEDSHEAMIRALGLKDMHTGHRRTFLRGEAPSGDMANYRIDESNFELPSWYTDNENGYRNKVAAILEQTNAIHKAVAQAQAAYDAAVAPAQAAYALIPGAIV